MLIEEYDLEITNLPCSPTEGSFMAKARLKVDISSVLPYLNAVLDKPVYYPKTPALTWRDAEYMIAFHSYEIDAEEMEDREEAAIQMEKVIKLVNDTWDNRADITPDFEARRPPAPTEVHKLLPLTNCKECGEETCFNFALKIAVGQANISACAPLYEEEYAEKLAAMRDLLT